MKKYIWIGCLLMMHLACQKLDIRPLTIFGNATLSQLTDQTAKMTTEMVDLAENATQHGYCWATTPNPTVSNTKVELGALSRSAESTISFSSDITGLTPNTRYYLRAYVQVAGEVFYSEQVIFNTLETSPFISANSVNNINNTTAETQGNILRLQTGISYTQYGHCWATQTGPTINDAKTELGQPTAAGPFTSNLTGLQAAQTYFVRAYLIISTGEVIYSNELTFTTLSN